MSVLLLTVGVCSFRPAHKQKWYVPTGVRLQISTHTEVTCTDGCAPSDQHTNQSDVPMGVLLQTGTQAEMTYQ